MHVLLVERSCSIGVRVRFVGVRGGVLGSGEDNEVFVGGELRRDD